MDFSGNSEEKLKLLSEETKAFIGRKKSIHSKYGEEGALLLGRSAEKANYGQKIYMDALAPHVVFITGSRGSGKCLVGDAEIQISNGRKVKIKDLKAHGSKVLSLNSDLKIEESEKTGFYEREVSRTIKLTLRSGKQIELTPEHPLLTLNGWIPANLLKEKDRIATPRKISFFGSSKMRDDEVKLLAYLLAEGHLSNSFVLFSNTDEKILNEFRKSVVSYDSNLKVSVHSKEGCYRVSQKKKAIDISNIKRNEKGQFTCEGFIVAQKSSMMKWLIKLGLYGKLAKQRELPEEVLTLNKKQLKLFLNRLFSCDGSIYTKSGYWQIDYSTASEKLAKQVQSLLLKFSVLSRIRKRKMKLNGKVFGAYELLIDSENVPRFIQEIGFFGEKEKKQKQALEELSKKKFNPNVDTIPKEIWKIHRIENWAKIGKILGYSSPKSLINSKRYAPSREKLLKIAKASRNKELEIMANSDIFWDEVASVEKLNRKTKVYDISVPKNHNFIANDIIVHNSYALGVIAEELILKNPNVASVIIDPVGIFWSMKYPNKEEKELNSLADWGLEPQGIEQTRVFIPHGLSKKVPRETYDRLFSIRPSELNVDDWCLTFGIERFSQSGLLLERAIEKAVEKHKNYSIEELIKIIETDKDLTSKERGYKTESRRALVSRLEAAKNWGVFSKDGTSLAEICKKGMVSVIDISFLEENVSSLVIGMLSRKILNARKMVTRQESMKGYIEEMTDIDQLLNTEIPPTWLFIDEAHTLIPSGSAKTAATDGLTEYVKQGRRPGCSLVFATQQPSAIDSKVLSQLDLLICHKLIFDEDLKAVMKRMPTTIPKEYDRTRFVKTLPIGIALTGDRSDETSRAFCIQMRPRFSQHEGREIKVGEVSEKIAPEKVKKLIVELIYKKLEETGRITLIKAEDTIDTIKRRYSTSIDNDEVIQTLMKAKKCRIEGDYLVIPGFEAQKEIESEIGEVKALTATVTKMDAEKIAERNRKRKKLGFFGKDEELSELKMIYEPAYRVNFNIRLNKGYSPKSILVSPDYEIYYYHNGFKKTRDVNEILELNEKSTGVLNAVMKTSDSKRISEISRLTPQSAGRYLNDLVKKGLVEKREKSFYLTRKLDIPNNLDDRKYSVFSKISDGNAQKGVELESVSLDEKLIERIPKLFSDCEVTGVETVLKPAWKATYVSGDEVRVQKFDAL